MMNTQALIKKTIDAMKARDLEAAERYASEILETEPDNPNIHILFGNIQLRKDAYDAAIESYRQSLKLWPDSAEANNNIGVAYRQNGDLDRGLSALRVAHRLSPDRPDICYNLANFLKQAGNVDEARAWYEKAIELDPGFVLAYNNLGNLIEQSGQHETAADLYRQGLKADKSNPSLRYNLGVALEAAGNNEEAVEEYRRALKVRPNWTENLNNLGITLHRIGKVDESKRAFETILRDDPKNARARNNLAMLLTDQGDTEGAEELLKSALEVDPGYTRAAQNLGHLYEESGDYGKAEVQFRGLLEQDPDNHSALYQYACVLILSGRLKEAAKHLRQIIKGDPKHVDALVAIGNILIRGGKPDRALSYLDRAQAISPELTTGRIFRAQAYRDLGKTELAIAELSYVLKQDPTHHDARLLLAELYLKNNLYSEAKGILDGMRSDYATDQDVLSATIRTLNAMGDQEQAIKIAEILVNIQNEQGNEDDLDSLHNALQLYEQVVNEYAQDHEELWERNLNAFVTASEEPYEEEQHVEEESLVFQGLADFEEETVPIIDVGEIEPIIVVDEDEEPSVPPFITKTAPVPEATPPIATSDTGTDPGSETGPTPEPASLGHQLPLQQTEDDLQIVEMDADIGVDPVEPVEPSQDVMDSDAEDPQGVMGVDPDDSIQLLARLEELSEYLPVEAKQLFDDQQLFLRMEALKQKLKGSKGIHAHNIPISVARKDTLPAAAVSPSAVADTFSFIGGLTESLPNKQIGLALSSKITHIVGIIRREFHG